MENFSELNKPTYTAPKIVKLGNFTELTQASVVAGYADNMGMSRINIGGGMSGR
jgi:hypothetical protein